MTLQPLSLKRWTQFPHHWNLGWPWDWLWLTEWNRSNGVLVPNLGLKTHCVFSLTLLLIYLHHENEPRMEMRYMNRNEPPQSSQLKPSRSATPQPTTSYMSDWAKNSPKELTERPMSYITTHSFKIPGFGVVCYTTFVTTENWICIWYNRYIAEISLPSRSQLWVYIYLCICL